MTQFDVAGNTALCIVSRYDGRFESINSNDQIYLMYQKKLVCICVQALGPYACAKHSVATQPQRVNGIIGLSFLLQRGVHRQRANSKNYNEIK